MSPEQVARLLMAQGIDVSRVMEAPGGTPDWLPEDAALACAGLPRAHEHAFRIRAAGDLTCLAPLYSDLMTEATYLHVRHRWPDRVEGRRWLPDVCRLVVVGEWMQGTRQQIYRHLVDTDQIGRLLPFSREAWDGVLRDAWTQLGARVEGWYGAACGHVARRTRDDGLDTA